MFDSPIEPCPVCGQMVLLDQTQVECAREHDCSIEAPCPLRKFFTGLDFSAALAKDRLREKGY
ncbi:MAG: hypothetical protein FIA96_01105 [Betaproteobacteria bacterium]|nr:hypothetical protein [Betaproteobacteria bacterium]